MSAQNDKMIREYLSQLYQSLQNVDYEELETVGTQIAEHTLHVTDVTNQRSIDDLKRLRQKLIDAFPDEPELVRACMLQYIKQGTNFSFIGSIQTSISQLVLQRVAQKFAQYVPE